MKPNCGRRKSGGGNIMTEWFRSRDVLNFWQISVNISKTVQDRGILSMKDE